MNSLKNLFIAISLLFYTSTYVFSQSKWFSFDNTTSVSVQNKTLAFPFAGGLNALQYSSMKLDNDEFEDLVIFDRTTSKVSTFIAIPSKKRYTYQPAYEALFPTMSSWMLLVDYDNDGEKDLFTYATEGARVYKKEYTTTSSWKWTIEKNYLTTTGLSGREINLQIVAADIPAIVDIDNDGDLDIISFDLQGDYVELNQNLSIELYGHPDSLTFTRNGSCWGNFMKHQCNDFILGVDCEVTSNLSKVNNKRVKHAGNALLIHDLNNDGLKDLLLGHVTCTNLSALWNNAPGLAANYHSFSSNYPTQNPVNFPAFPAAYLEDINFDGKKDLLVSTNVYNNDGNSLDFCNSSWAYLNTSSSNIPEWSLQTTSFLQEDMIDVGENASPSYVDINGDGLLDLIIGNAGMTNNGIQLGTLHYYKNTGTASLPHYELQTDDYLEIGKQLSLSHLRTFWQDLNQDGMTDLIIIGQKNRLLEAYSILNKGSRNSPIQLSSSDAIKIPLPTDISMLDQPYFYDVDQNGSFDLLVGKANGQIHWYENKGSNSSYTFTLVDYNVANITPSFSGRFLSLAIGDVDVDGKIDLLTVDISGKLTLYYEGDWNKWTKKETELISNSLSNSNYSPILGNYLTVTITDYNGDKKPDITVGTYAGGLYLLKNEINKTITGIEPIIKFTIYPNPSRNNHFKITTPQNGTIELFNSLGIKIQSYQIQHLNPIEVNHSNWQPGIYLIKFTTNSGSSTKKIVIQ